MDWLFWGILAALGTCVWSLLLLSAPNGLKETLLDQFCFIRIIFIVAGAISLASFIVPNLGITSQCYTLIQNREVMGLILGAAMVLLGYQVVILMAFRYGGILAHSLINLNIVFLVMFAIYYWKFPINTTLTSVIAVYVMCGIYINYKYGAQINGVQKGF